MNYNYAQRSISFINFSFSFSIAFFNFLQMYYLKVVCGKGSSMWFCRQLQTQAESTTSAPLVVALVSRILAEGSVV